jgi:hypothetical protein
MAHDPFISHAHQDRAQAQLVCDALEQAGIRCWIAPRDIPPSCDWDKAVARAIREAWVVVVVFSRQADSSEHVQNEVAMAVDHRKPVIVFRVADANPTSGLELHLKRRNWLNAFPGPVEDYLPQLIGAVIAHLPPLARLNAAPNPRDAFAAAHDLKVLGNRQVAAQLTQMILTAPDHTRVSAIAWLLAEWDYGESARAIRETTDARRRHRGAVSRLLWYLYRLERSASSPYIAETLLAASPVQQVGILAMLNQHADQLVREEPIAGAVRHLLDQGPPPTIATKGQAFLSAR